MSDSKWNKILEDQRNRNYALPFYIKNPIQQISPPLYNPFE